MKNKLRLLNGCAKSKFIAEAFEQSGWEVWTCDILPPESRGKHIQDDVLKHLNDGWDMGIFHPDCTALALSGVRWMYVDGELNQVRYEQVRKSAEFFNRLLNAKIPKICLENPIQHHFAREFIRQYDQIIQPWNFGHLESKATCLYGLLDYLCLQRKLQLSLMVFSNRFGDIRQAKREKKTGQEIRQKLLGQWLNSGGT